MANIRKSHIRLAQFIRQLALSMRKSPSYKRMWKNNASKIEAFELYLGKKIYSDSFTAEVMDSYIYFLKSSEKKYASSTVQHFGQKAGEAIRKAEKAGYKANFGFLEVDLPTPDDVSVYLTSEEIQRIFNLKKLTKEAYAARERFVVACCTGMRHGDIKDLSRDNFSNGNVCRKTRKTGVFVIIPQHWMVKEILARNAGDLPQIHSHQAYNTMVKRLCKKAQITEKVLVERTRGTRVERKLIPKYQLVSSHTARRSLATNMYLSGIPAARIMLITGHTTEQSFFKYIRINKTENAKELALHPFFNNVDN